MSTKPFIISPFKIYLFEYTQYVFFQSDSSGFQNEIVIIKFWVLEIVELYIVWMWVLHRWSISVWVIMKASAFQVGETFILDTK